MAVYHPFFFKVYSTGRSFPPPLKTPLSKKSSKTGFTSKVLL
jgi:hypothetical protein